MGGGGGAKFFDEGLGQVFSPLGFHEHWPESWQLGKPGRARAPGGSKARGFACWQQFFGVPHKAFGAATCH